MCERQLLKIFQCGKAVQESVYTHFRVLCEGQLCVIFTQELKIASWEFCAQWHEELVRDRLIAPQCVQGKQAVLGPYVPWKFKGQRLFVPLWAPLDKNYGTNDMWMVVLLSLTFFLVDSG
ncbi:hypothetical protein Ancab_014835 [Ancistrocladus abbreviatus]